MTVAQPKSIVEMLTQYANILPRVKNYSPLVAHKIKEVLEHFSGLNENFEHVAIDMRKIEKFPLEKFRTRLQQLLEFNKAHGTRRSSLDYLYESLRRGSYIKFETFKKIHMNLGYLKDIGFTEAEIAERLWHDQVFSFSPKQKIAAKYIDLSPERNLSYIIYLKKQIGMSSLQIKEFLSAYPQFFSTSLTDISNKINTLIRIKFFQTQTHVQHFLLCYPRFLNSSIDRLTKTVEGARLHSNNDELLHKFPVLFYLKPDSDFFLRVVKGLRTGHKSYIRIYERLADKHGAKKAYIPDYAKVKRDDIQATTRYLDDLRDQIYILGSKDFDVSCARIFTDLEPYLGKGEKKFLQEIWQKQMTTEERLHKDEHLAFEFIRKKIFEQSAELHNRLQRFFEYAKNMNSYGEF